MKPRIYAGLSAATAACLSVHSTAEGKPPIYVANNGADGSLCGNFHFPCRTISQAIANASDGDTIFVGPGFYGDVDGDDALAGPEDEKGCLTTARQCLIDISKPLTILSTEGARVTKIGRTAESSNPSSLDGFAAVVITSRDVQFGAIGKGFTVSGARHSAGIMTATNGDRLRINGNIVTGNQVGILIDSKGPVVYVFSNLAIANETGFSTTGRPVHFTDDAAQENGIGFSVVGLSGNGFSRLRRNTASSNGVGFQLQGPWNQFENNTVVGNLRSGITVLKASGSSPVTYGGFYRSRIFGNGMTSDSPANCGVRNESDATIYARFNYWGADSGPGPDPADAVCNAGASVTSTDNPLPYPRDQTYSAPIAY